MTRTIDDYIKIRCDHCHNIVCFVDGSGIEYKDDIVCSACVMTKIIRDKELQEEWERQEKKLKQATTFKIIPNGDK